MSHVSPTTRIIWTCLALLIAVVGLVSVNQAVVADYTAAQSPLILVWSSPEAGDTSSAAWADWDGDGDLDLAIGSEDIPNRVYANVGGGLVLAWEAESTQPTKSLAWGDWDNDGDLDLAVGNYNQPNRIYANTGTSLAPGWEAPLAEATASLAWGDWDNDNDLDLAVGSYQRVRVYANHNGDLISAWDVEASNNWVSSVAWGDWDNDDDLDLAVSLWHWSALVNSQNVLYENSGGYLSQTPTPITKPGRTASLAWGDWDKNGYIDLAVGYAGQPTAIYTNQGGSLALAWQSATTRNSRSVAWGDWDDDGDLDLAVGNGSGAARPTFVYQNDGVNSSPLPAWVSSESGATLGLAWGDWDGDGDLDLATANHYEATRVYENQLGQPLATAWQSNEAAHTIGAAWGDWDGDHDLDLAVSTGGAFSEHSYVYANSGAGLADSFAWQSPDPGQASVRLAWGDVDEDGDLDLAITGLPASQTGTSQTAVTIYVNVNGTLTPGQTLVGGLAVGVSWSDWDGDGDLDLAVAEPGVGAHVFANTAGILNLTWTGAANYQVMDVTWGDWEGDGDPDLAVGSLGNPIQVYRNQAGVLQLAWESTPYVGRTLSLDWGDWDADGDLDLAVGNSKQPCWVFETVGDGLRLGWQSAESDHTVSVDWGDWDGDGDLDLAVGNNTPANRVYINQGDGLELAWSSPTNEYTTGLDWGDWDRDGDLDLAYGNYDLAGGLAFPIKVYANASMTGRAQPAWAQIDHPAGAGTPEGGNSRILNGPIIPINYTLFSDAPSVVRFVRAFYSVDNGIHWRPASGVEASPTHALAASPAGESYTYLWDIHASQVFGQSDLVIFRLDVYPGFSEPGPYRYPFRSAYSLPFRLRGSQVRVVDSGGAPLAQATVHRQPAGQAGYILLADAIGRPLLTNAEGYLPGFSEILAGDQLVALAPISTTQTYTLYHSNGEPTPSGLIGFEVMSSGVQTITVSAEHPIIGFDLDISLEWDARRETSFLTQLENDLQRTGHIVYDLTNGQVILEKVRVHHARALWDSADIIIQATNNQRPAAMAGGVVVTPTDDVDIYGAPIPDAYVPGQARMGPTWTRFGDPGGTLGEDWPRALAHELGHYLFFLPDNYVGIADNGAVITTDCYGSVMSDPYTDSYSEFLTAGEWQGECEDTLAAAYLGRADWETIAAFYPMLNAITINPGPTILPLAVTSVTFVEPLTPPTALPDPFFSLVDEDGAPSPVASGEAQAFLFKTNATDDATDDYVQALGSPLGDLTQARGAQPGDRLCVFDHGPSPMRIGCQVVGNTPSPVTLVETPNWSPQILVTKVSSYTFTVTVTQAQVGELWVQLYSTLATESSAPQAMTPSGSGFSQTITLSQPTNSGYIRIWATGGPQEALTEFLTVADWGTKGGSWGTKGGSWGTKGGSWGAPLLTPDGQAAIFLLDNPFANTTGYTLQTLLAAPNLPGWLTAIGPTYRLDSDETLANGAILFHYLGRDVPGGYEAMLRVYYSADTGQTWQRLPTTLDLLHNHASASLAGEGLYTLAVTVEIAPILQGEAWNLFGYPVPGAQALPQALASIEGAYTSVYNFDPILGWRLYATTVQAPFGPLVNTLSALEYGRGYWLYATETISLYLGIGGGEVATLNTVTWPPATYYGWVTPEGSFSPVVGDSVLAKIDSNLCGMGTVVAVEGALAYSVQVQAESPFAPWNGCGTGERVVTFEIDDYLMAPTVLWDNRQAYWLPLSPLPEESNLEGPARVSAVNTRRYHAAHAPR